MNKTLELPEATYRALQSQAAAVGVQPAELIARWLDRSAQEHVKSAEDTLAALVGTLTCASSDVADRHDDYIGRGVISESCSERDLH